jgi:hypothetical protein
MQTRSQTKANSINLLVEEMTESFERKTRLIRRSNIVPVPKNDNNLPQHVFTTVRTRSQTRALDMYIRLRSPTSDVVETNSIKQKNTSNEKNDKYQVDIDFDDASRAWRKNKISVGNGCYEYK